MTTETQVARSSRPRWPGEAQRVKRWFRAEGHIIFIKGTVIFASDTRQFIEHDAKQLTPDIHTRHIHLIGERYLYWCPKCARSVIQWELLTREALGFMGFDVVSENRPRCPYCLNHLDPVRVGDKVRLHYRITMEGGYPCGDWYAERWDW